MHKLAFLFPGQGSHYVGMCQNLYEEYSIIRETFQEAEEVLGVDLKSICFDGPLYKLSKTENAHTAIFTSSVAIFRTFMKETGYKPQFLTGHSLGEYAALTCSGVFKFKDGLNIVKRRAELAIEAEKVKDGAMTIVDGIDIAMVEKVCSMARMQGKEVYISCYNTNRQLAISGTREAVMDIEEQILDAGGQITPLIGSAPYHCPLMEDASLELEQLLKEINIGYFRYPVVSNYTGKAYLDRDSVIKNLKYHFTNPVRWTDSMAYIGSKGVSMTIEMGVKNLLTNMIKDFDFQSRCFGQKDERKELIELFTGTESYKKHMPTFISKCLVAAVSTKNRNHDNRQYEDGVIKQYKKIQEMYNLSLTESGYSNFENFKEALRNLQIIFDTKNVNREEQSLWISQILDETGMSYLLKTDC